MVDVPVTVEPLEHKGHEGLIHEFVQCVRTGSRPETSCQDNIKSLAMVLAAVESVKKGRRVPVRW
jgi:predicted dehydrogenase